MEVREMEKRKLGIQGSAYIGKGRSKPREAVASRGRQGGQSSHGQCVATGHGCVARMRLGWRARRQELGRWRNRGRCMRAGVEVRPRVQARVLGRAGQAVLAMALRLRGEEELMGGAGQSAKEMKRKRIGK